VTGATNVLKISWQRPSHRILYACKHHPANQEECQGKQYLQFLAGTPMCKPHTNAGERDCGYGKDSKCHEIDIPIE